jgi:hypothetical protein
MKRVLLTVAAALLLCIGAGALPAAGTRSAPQPAPAVRAPYDPFSLQRAANAPPGTVDNRGLERRREIHRWLRERVRPPHRQPPRSPNRPNDGNNGHGNDDDHDDEDNPGQGGGNHGTGNNGNGNGNNGNHGNGNNGNGNH